MRAENANLKNALSHLSDRIVEAGESYAVLQAHSADSLKELIVLRGEVQQRRDEKEKADKLIISQHMELEGAFSQNRNMVLQIMGLKEKLEQAGKDLYALQHDNTVVDELKQIADKECLLCLIGQKTIDTMYEDAQELQEYARKMAEENATLKEQLAEETKRVEEYEENYEEELKEAEKELERAFGRKMKKMKTQLSQLKRFAGKNGLFFCPQCKLVLNEGLLCYDCQEINEKNIPPLI